MTSAVISLVIEAIGAATSAFLEYRTDAAEVLSSTTSTEADRRPGSSAVVLTWCRWVVASAVPEKTTATAARLSQAAKGTRGPRAGCSAACEDNSTPLVTPLAIERA